eukprot:scaffold19153_cov80-Skeletonema_menzelii.AAC.4
MGGGLTFLSKKSFNPQNWSNQRRVWEARQNSESERRRIVEREAQIKREREEEELARVVGGEEEGGRKALGFMYDGGKIPGLKKEGNGTNNHYGGEDEHAESKRYNSGGDDTDSNLFQRQPGDDDAAAAFRAMLAQGVTAYDNTDKHMDETNQYNVMDAQTNEAEEDDANNANEAMDNRTKLEKAVGRGINSGSGVTLAQQMERFPMLKGAPMVLQKQKNKGGDGEKKEQAATTTGMNFKPLGQVLRNVQCLACKKWGHARGDRECDLSGWDPFRMNDTAAATAATSTTTSAAPDNLANVEVPRAAATTLRPDHDKTEEEPSRQKAEKKHKKRRKGDRHERKKKSKKHKRRRHERSPSYSSDSYSSSYVSYSSDEERYKKRRRGYRSDDSSDSRRRSRKGRRKKSSRR